MNRVPDVLLSPRGLARFHSGHPWIFRADVGGDEPPGDADSVRVLDGAGRVVGSAFWAPPPSPTCLRVYARGGEYVPFSDELLAERLARAEARRKEIYGHGTPAYRLAHAEADLLPGLFVDRYGDAAVLQAATIAMDRREKTVAHILAKQHGIRLVVARDDGSMRDHESLPRRKQVLLGGGPTLMHLVEAGATRELDLLEDAKTGGFLDQRENHLCAAALARGEVLDAFTYHGGFALAMARRAEKVLGLDEDPRAVARAKRNASLSHVGNAEFQVADAFEALRRFEREGRTFDVVVVDPPALAKRRGEITTALRAYQELNLRALRIVRQDGWVITCSCSGKVTPQLFGEMLVRAAQGAKRDVALVERRGAGRDHPVLVGVPETEYLKCWFLKVVSSGKALGASLLPRATRAD
ncbi:MAG: class I SAM-dependent rRNA methyltransferase [Deltaproteobacteria bacterium]|nr:class I SAM-dependent rRNA methyltransferase [Deltaproteobacteria bacterium]